MITDVVQDSCTDACRVLQLDDVHQLFLCAAHARRENDIHGNAQTAFSIWAREGFDALPESVRDFVLRVCNGEYTEYRKR